MRKFPLLFALTVLAVSACGPVTPVPAPTALPTSVPASPVPTATVPTLPDIVPAQAWHSSDLEPITPQNVGRLEQIDRRDGGKSAHTPLFSPDGRVLAYWGYYDIDFFSMLDGAPLSSVSPQPPESGFNLLRFNADGSLIVTGISSVGRDGGPWPPEYELSVWDVRTGNRLKTLVPATSFLYNILSTPDKNMIAAVDFDGLHFWDLQKGVLLRTIDKCGLVAFDQTGNQMAAAFRDRIEISDFRTGKIYQTITASINELPQVFFNRDASKLAIIFGRKLEVFDTNSGELVYQVEFVDHSHFPIVFGDLFVLGPRLWDFEHNQPVRTLSDSRTFTFTPDGQMLLSLIRNHIRFWDLNTGLLLREVVLGFMKPTLYRISDIALSPDGRLIAITGDDGMIHVLGVKKP